MKTLATSLAGLSTAAAITFGGLYFAPNQTTPAQPHHVEVDLRTTAGDPVREGEVTTTVYNVVDATGANPRRGTKVKEYTGHDFTLKLPVGEYLVQTVVNRSSDIWHTDDTDGNVAVPANAQCQVHRLDCTWIEVTDTAWKLHGKAVRPERLRFDFMRPTPTPPPPTTQPQTIPPAAPTNRVGTPTPKTASQSATQSIHVAVWDETDGEENAVRLAGVTTLVTYVDPASQAPIVVSGRTDGQGRADHRTPVLAYDVNIVPPPGYEVSERTQLGHHEAVADEPTEMIHVAAVRRIRGVAPKPSSTPAPAPAPTEIVPSSGNQTPGPTPPATPNATPGPPTPPVTDVPAAPPTTPTPTPTPTSTPAPAPAPTSAPPATAPPATEAPRQLGCDESDDPEIQALLQLDDGAIRWIENGELLTLFPEDGMQPVGVCSAAYERMIAMGISPEYVTPVR